MMMRIIAVAVFSFAFAGSAHADVWMCKKGGQTWMTNQKVKGARCKLFSKSPPRRKRAPDPPVQPAAGQQPPGQAPGAAPVGAGQQQPQAVAPAAQWHSRAGTYQRGGQAPPQGYAPAPQRLNRPSQERARSRKPDEPRQRAGREALYGPYLEEAAQLYDLPESFLKAIVRVESDFRYRKRDKARGGRGIMLLTETDARELGVTDRLDPRASLLGGARRLRRLANAHRGKILDVLVAWRAGDSKVGSELSSSTKRWVTEVLDAYYRYKDAAER